MNFNGNDRKYNYFILNCFSGVMCEYDALPGIGHACGHNLIAILGLAIACGIKDVMDSGDLKGKVT